MYCRTDGCLPWVGKIAALLQVGFVLWVLCACKCAAICGGHLETTNKVTCWSSRVCPKEFYRQPSYLRKFVFKIILAPYVLKMKRSPIHLIGIYLLNYLFPAWYALHPVCIYVFKVVRYQLKLGNSLRLLRVFRMRLCGTTNFTTILLISTIRKEKESAVLMCSVGKLS